MPPVELDTISHVVSEYVHHGKDEFSEPIFTRSRANRSHAPLLEPIIDDVEVPSAPVVTSEDLSVPTIAEPPREVEMMVSGLIDQVASYTLVRTALKTVDYALNICEKVAMNIAPPATKYVQKLRRYLRVIRHAGRRHARAAGGNVDNRKTRSLRDLPARKKKAMREASITGYFADLFKVNFLLSYLGMELMFNEGAPKQHKSDGHVTDDEESTVYKLMKEYDSQDDEDYFPSDSSEDSMEYESDSENETTEDKLNKHYPEHSDEDYVPSEEESKESIEYNSEAEVSQDAEESQEEAEEAVESREGAEEVNEEERRTSSSSVESTTVDKLMKDSEDDDVSQDDLDYVPEEKSEDSCEYNSDEEAIKYDAQDYEPVEVADEASQDSDAPVADSQEIISQDDSQEAPESQEDSQEVEELREDSQEVEELREDSQEVEELREDSQEVEELREDSPEVEELREDSPEVEELREDSHEEELREDSPEVEELREDSHEEELREDSHEEELREDSPEMEPREDSQEMDEMEELREDSHEEELREDSHEEELREDSHEEDLREDSFEEELIEDAQEADESEIVVVNEANIEY